MEKDDNLGAENMFCSGHEKTAAVDVVVFSRRPRRTKDERAKNHLMHGEECEAGMWIV